MLDENKREDPFMLIDEITKFLFPTIHSYVLNWEMSMFRVILYLLFKLVISKIVEKTRKIMSDISTLCSHIS